MAEFEVTGLDNALLSMREIAKLDDNVVYDLLQPGAEILVKAMQATLTSIGAIVTGKLRKSLNAYRKVDPNMGYAYYDIYPSGPHHKYRASGGKRRKRNAGAIRTTRANDVGFVLEVGNKRIKARHWMANSVDTAVDQVIASENEAWAQYLESKNH